MWRIFVDTMAATEGGHDEFTRWCKSGVERWLQTCIVISTAPAPNAPFWQIYILEISLLPVVDTIHDDNHAVEKELHCNVC